MPLPLHKEFAVHVLTDEKKDKAVAIAEAFDELLTKLEGICPNGRPLALCRTHLETACFFAKKAMAEDPVTGGFADVPGSATR